MLIEFASLQLTREELEELHRALLMRAVVEDELQRERGQKTSVRPDLLEKLERLLGENDERLETLETELGEELWEYVWFAFTDEWAHYRAHEDAEQENARARSPRSDEETSARAHTLYQKRFNEYVEEISMFNETPRPTRSPQRHQGSSKRSA